MSAITTKLSLVIRLSRQQVAPLVCLQRRNDSNVAAGGQLSNLAAHKRGTGGRSSFRGIVATVFGGTGFVGRNVINKLGKIGCQVVVGYRGDDYQVKDLRLAGDLGQILFQHYNLRDEDSIRKCMEYSDVVINLVGRDYETKNYTYMDVHSDGAARIARLTRESGIKHLIHLSHLNASPNPPRFYAKGSELLRSKFVGEQRVREEFPDVVVLRPADIYGSNDRFLFYYTSRLRRHHFHLIPLWKRGEKTVKMPVYMGDVATGIVNAATDPGTAGRTYDAVGPSTYRLSDLIDYFLTITEVNDFHRVPLTPLFRLKTKLCYLWPLPKLMPDKLESEFVNDERSCDLALPDLGVKLARLEDRIYWELRMRSLYQYYQDDEELKLPDPPAPVLPARYW